MRLMIHEVVLNNSQEMRHNKKGQHIIFFLWKFTHVWHVNPHFSRRNVPHEFVGIKYIDQQLLCLNTSHTFTFKVIAFGICRFRELKQQDSGNGSENVTQKWIVRSFLNFIALIPTLFQHLTNVGNIFRSWIMFLSSWKEKNRCLVLMSSIKREIFTS